MDTGEKTCLCMHGEARYQTFHCHASQKQIGVFLCEKCFARYPELRRFHGPIKAAAILRGQWSGRNIGFRDED